MLKNLDVGWFLAGFVLGVIICSKCQLRIQDVPIPEAETVDEIEQAQPGEVLTVKLDSLRQIVKNISRKARVVTIYKTKTQLDTLLVRDTITITDTVTKTKYVKTHLHFVDDYVSLQVNPDSLRFNLAVIDTAVFQVVTRNDTARIDVTNRNPYVVMAAPTMFLPIERQVRAPEQKIRLGIFVGVGYTQSRLAPAVGIGLTLKSFKNVLQTQRKSEKNLRRKFKILRRR